MRHLATRVTPALLVFLVIQTALGQTSAVRISQVFGFGGASPTCPKSDFVELYNASDAAVSLSGWTLQSNENGSAPWDVVPLTGTIQPRRYFLIQLGAAASLGIALPTADVGPFATYANYLQNSGKVALVTNATPLLGRPECPFPSQVVDFVGFGSDPAQDQRSPCTSSGATSYNAPACAWTPTVLSIQRGCGGEYGTGNNAADFVALPPVPRNSSYVPSAQRPSAVNLVPSSYTPIAGQTFIVTAYAMTCSSEVSSVVANFSGFGGPASVPLTAQGGGAYAGSLVIPPGLAAASYTYSVTLTDTLGGVATASQSLTTLPAVPGNDHCTAGALPQYQLAVGVPVTGDSTSADSDSPPACFAPLGHTVWYTFVPTQSRSYRFSTCGSATTTDTSLGLFTTPDCQTFTVLGCDDDTTVCLPLTTTRHLSAIDCSLLAGTMYYVCVGGGGPYQLEVDTIALIGESCSRVGSVPLESGGLSTVTGSNEFAQVALDGPPFSCAAQTSRDVWYAFVTPDGQPEQWQIDTCGSTFDTVLAVYEWDGSCDTLVEQACNDDAQTGDCAGSVRSSLLLTLRAQFHYMIRVAAKGASAPGGIFQINIKQMSPPDNGTCAQARSWSTAAYYHDADNALDSIALDPNAPPIACAAACKDVFWVYSPPATASYDISTCDGTTQDTVLQVLGGCGAGAQVLACNDDFAGCGNGTQSKVTVTLTYNHDYYIRVASKGASAPGGPIFVNIVRTPPVNDTCETALPVLEGVEIVGNSAGADVTSPLPESMCSPSTNQNPSPYVDVFYLFVPAEIGLFTIDTCGSTDHCALSVHSGCPTGIANTLACTEPGNAVCSTGAAVLHVPLAAGQSYFVRVASPDFGGPFVLHVNRIAAAGACCRGSTCEVSAPQDCAGSDSFYAGDGMACNSAGNNTTPCCKAGFDHLSGVTVQDIFSFLNAWFLGSSEADFNGDSAETVQDIFDFLSAWFAGCP